MTPTDLSLSIATGLIASIISLIATKLYYLNKFKREYNKYNGNYTVHKKYEPNETIHGKLHIEVKQNKFILTLSEVPRTETITLPAFEGEINFDRLSSKRGVGYYKQTGKGKVGYGFIECQLANNDILLHLTWFDSFRNSVHDAYRCVKLPTDESK